jgi:hypothetical protein
LVFFPSHFDCFPGISLASDLGDRMGLILFKFIFRIGVKKRELFGRARNHYDEVFMMNMLTTKMYTLELNKWVVKNAQAFMKQKLSADF